MGRDFRMRLETISDNDQCLNYDKFFEPLWMDKKFDSEQITDAYRSRLESNSYDSIIYLCIHNLCIDFNCK